MKGSLRYNICLWMVWVQLALLPMLSFTLSAQSVEANTIQSPLWVVDGYALRDSVFRYSIREIQSDSAAMLVERSLSYVSISDIKSISCVEDSAQTINIRTNKEIPIFVVLNGEGHKSDITIPVGAILSGFDWIQKIIKTDFPYLDECGIEKAFVLREDIKQIFCHLQRGVVLIITTRKPYNKVKAVLDHAMPNLNIKPHQDKGGKR